MCGLPYNSFIEEISWMNSQNYKAPAADNMWFPSWLLHKTQYFLLV